MRKLPLLLKHPLQNDNLSSKVQDKNFFYLVQDS